MTKREKHLLNYLRDNEGLTYDELSVFDSPKYGHINRKCIDSLISTDRMKYRTPGSESVEITLKGIEALEIDHRETMRFIISNGIAFIALIISIVSICLQYL